MEKNTNSFSENKKKLTVLVVAMLAGIVACIIVACMMFGVTLARYQTLGTAGDKNLPIAKWGVEADITDNLHIVSNDYVVDGKMAPATEGYVDVKIKLPGTEVAVDYTITVGNITLPTGVTGVTLPDTLKVDRVVPRTDNDTTADASKDGTALDGTSGVYTGKIELPKDENNKNTAFAADYEFVVRIYFKWENDDTKNTADTALGNAAPTLTFTLKVDAQQHIPADDTTGG